MITQLYEFKSVEDMDYLELRRCRKRAEWLATGPLVKGAGASGMTAIVGACGGSVPVAMASAGACLGFNAAVRAAEEEARILGAFERAHPSPCKPLQIVCAAAGEAIGEFCVIL